MSTALIVTCLSSCKEPEQLESVEFDEPVIALKDFKPGYGIVYGTKGIYVLYGTFNSVHSEMTEGQCYLYSPPSKKSFPIWQAIDKFPELRTEQSEKAALRQQL
jgi:hypothetical protein